MIAIFDKIFGDTTQIPKTRASLFYRFGGYQVGELSIDLILNEEHALTSTITSHPVEDGSVISDHIRNELQAGSLTALVSNHSLRATTATPDAEPEQIIQDAQYAVLENRALAAYRTLKAIRDARKTITIVTVLEVYNDVAINSISINRDRDSGEALEFTLSFVQVKKVKLQSTAITAAVQPASMDTDLDRKSAVTLNGGQKVASGNYSMNEVLVKLGI